MPVVRELTALLGFQLDQQSIGKADNKILSFRNALGGLAKLAGGISVAFIAKEMISLASSAEETESKLNATFGSAASAVMDFAKTASVELGRSEYMIREFIGATGAMVKPILQNDKAAAELSQNFAKLAVDLSSFFDASEEDSLRALQSGLIGSTEPLRKFGVVMTQASLQAFALSQGITKNIQSMSQAELVSLRYKFILKSTSDAQGDAARTAGGFANTMRRLQGRVKDIGTDLGKFLLPPLVFLIDTVLTVGEVVIKVFKNVFGVFKGLYDLFRIVNHTFGLFGSIALGAVLGVSALAIAVAAIGKAALLSAAETAILWLMYAWPAIAAIALVSAAIALLGAAIWLVLDDIIGMGNGAESVTGTMIQGFMDLVDEVGGVGAAIWEMLTTATSAWGNTIKVAGAFYDKLLGISKIVAIVTESVKMLFSWLGQTGGAIWDKVKGYASIIGNASAGGALGMTMSPYSATPRTSAGNSVNNSQQNKVEVTVNAQTNSSAADIGTAVKESIWDAMQSDKTSAFYALTPAAS